MSNKFLLSVRNSMIVCVVHIGEVDGSHHRRLDTDHSPDILEGCGCQTKTADDEVLCDGL